MQVDSIRYNIITITYENRVQNQNPKSMQAYDNDNNAFVGFYIQDKKGAITSDNNVDQLCFVALGKGFSHQH